MRRQNQLLLFAVAIALYSLLNIASKRLPLRWDMTAAREHSISEAAKKQLNELSSSVTIRYYASVGDNATPYALRVYGEKVEYYLDILEREGRGEIEVIRYDPKPGSDAEKSAQFDNITSNFNRNQGRFYFGLSISCLDQKVKIPFLHPDREALLEYDILQAIGNVTNKNHKTIGILSSLPVLGGEYSNQSGKGVFPPWLFVSELQKSYHVVSYEKDIAPLQTNPPDLLLVIHPINLEETKLRAVDQHIGNGGKAIVMLDPYSGAIEMINPDLQKDFMDSNFDTLLKAWGVNYIPVEVVADMNHRSEVDRGFGPETMHTVLEIPQRYIHKTDPVTAGINILGFPYAGHFWPSQSMSTRMVPLVSTSESVSTIRPEELYRISREDNEALMKSFEADGRRRVIAAKLLGGLETAYPETERTSQIEDGDCQVILFADTDFVFDPFAGESVQLSTSEATIKPYNGNLALFSNAVDALIGEEGLLAARGKGAVRYPLVGLSDIKLDIEKAHETQRLEAHDSLADIEAKLVAASKEEKQQDMGLFIERKKAFNQLLAEKEQLEASLLALDSQIDYALQQVKNRYQWANTLGVPLLALLVGAVVIFRRNSRSRAQ
ncbi:MAG: Gldg family protein [Opitutaceae bacterium]